MPIILSAPAKRKNGTKKHKPTPKAVNAEAVAAARAIGQTAYARGIGSAPAQDPMLRPLIGAASGDTATVIAMLDAWTKEWHKAQRAESDAEIAALGLFPKQNGRRKNGARRDVLSEDARKSGYYVATYSPGDGKTRYRFFDLADMARRGVSTAEQDYFGPLNGIHTAVGLAAAKKFLNAPAKRKNGAAGSVVIYDASGRAVSKSKNLAGIIRHARNRLVSSINVSPSGVLSIRWEDGTHVDTPFADPSVAVSWAQSREWLKETPVTRKNGRKASLPPMRNNGARSTTAAEIKAAVLAGADGSYLTDVARAPALRGVHFARIEAAAEALAKAGKVSYDGITVTRKNGRKAPARRNGSRSTVDPVAARELELYIENEANLVGPGNSLGANIMRMLAGRIVRGTYDSTKAWKAWVPLTTEGAKRYKREIGPINASKATRDAVATRLSEAFESEVRSGGLDPMKLLGKR